jgi:hypothetical protein
MSKQNPQAISRAENQPEAENQNPTTEAAGAAPTAPEAASSLLPPNPFANLEALRLPQDFAGLTRVKKLLTEVPVRKPRDQEFFRVHPSPNYQLPQAAIIELKEDGETFFVHPSIAPEVLSECRVAHIVTVMNRQGVLTLWPIKLPSGDNKRTDSWSRSTFEHAQRAMTEWIRIRANMGMGAYEAFQAESKLPDPEWPTTPFQELLRLGFRDHFVDTIDHFLLKRLRGAT